MPTPASAAVLHTALERRRWSPSGAPAHREHAHRDRRDCGSADAEADPIATTRASPAQAAEEVPKHRRAHRHHSSDAAQSSPPVPRHNARVTSRGRPRCCAADTGTRDGGAGQRSSSRLQRLLQRLEVEVQQADGVGVGETPLAELYRDLFLHALADGAAWERRAWQLEAEARANARREARLARRLRRAQRTVELLAAFVGGAACPSSQEGTSTSHAHPRRRAETSAAVAAVPLSRPRRRPASYSAVSDLLQSSLGRSLHFAYDLQRSSSSSSGDSCCSRGETAALAAAAAAAAMTTAPPREECDGRRARRALTSSPDVQRAAVLQRTEDEGGTAPSDTAACASHSASSALPPQPSTRPLASRAAHPDAPMTHNRTAAGNAVGVGHSSAVHSLLDLLRSRDGTPTVAETLGHTLWSARPHVGATASLPPPPAHESVAAAAHRDRTRELLVPTASSSPSSSSGGRGGAARLRLPLPPTPSHSPILSRSLERGCDSGGGGGVAEAASLPSSSSAHPPPPPRRRGHSGGASVPVAAARVSPHALPPPPTSMATSSPEPIASVVDVAPAYRRGGSASAHTDSVGERRYSSEDWESASSSGASAASSASPDVGATAAATDSEGYAVWRAQLEAHLIHGCASDALPRMLE
ncbi:hypothetical protein NESM_000527800 [Novymonas esmeraldas]|uniref:Uncharacterized protein n=1 Tax=Novymonas esmeraldas TaxID=1808958 RepID=A0AAW0EPE3_9TRYP